MNNINQKGIALIAIILIVIGVLAAAGGIWYWQSQKKAGSVVCTQEAKLCPDGSSVSRVPLNCEFTPCPLSKGGINFSFLYEGEKPEYFDNDVGVGDHLYYRIEAIDENGKVTKYYAPVTAIIPQTTTVFNDTKDLWAWGTKTYTDLKWNPYDFKKFKVYRGIPIIDQTSNWQTYRNERYGFEVKYPENFIAQDSRITTCKGISFWDKDFLSTHDISVNKIVTFDIFLNSLNEKCVDGHYSSPSGPGAKTYKFLNQTQETISNQEFLKKNYIDIVPGEQQAFKFSSWHITNKDSRYTLIYNNGVTVNPEPHENLFDQILSTFKFIK